MPVTLRARRSYALSRGNTSQRGIVLIVALIVLVAMTLTGVALMRSTTSGNRVAGNLAFRQSATLSADTGIEAAITWLEANSAGNTLFQNSVTASDAYVASRFIDPTGTQTWET